MKHKMCSGLTWCAIAVTLLCVSVSAEAQSQSSYQALSDKFFNMLQQDKNAEAVDFLFATNPNMKKIGDKTDQLKAQFASLRTIVGPYSSHALLVETKVAGMFVYQHYFVAYERQPISIRIKYYKPGTTWLCYGLQFDADLDDKIEQLADTKIISATK